MKAISLWQPWATLCVIGAKKWETRPRPIRYRGPIFIASTKHTQTCYRRLAVHEPFKSALAGFEEYMVDGAILGTVEVTDCIPTGEWMRKFCKRDDKAADREHSFGNYDPGRYAWKLERPVYFREPVKCRGSQGFWFVPPELRPEVMAAELASRRLMDIK